MITRFIPVLLLLTGVPAILGKPKHVSLNSLPAVFEPNLGQAGVGVRFISRGVGQSLLLMDDGVVVQSGSAGRIRIRPLGGSRNPHIEGMSARGGVSNYLKGASEKDWIRGVPHYERVRYQALYPGVDLVFYGTHRQFEFDLLVMPAANPRQIRFAVDGVQKLSRSRQGELLLKTSSGELRLGKPVAYQPASTGRRSVECEFAIGPGHSFGFRLGQYDPALPLVIDPTLFSTYLGGLDVDIPSAVATDPQGNIYVTGYTASTNLLVTAGNFKAALTPGDADAFVMKLNSTATSVVYSTYLGGVFADYARAIAVDSTGAAYITGTTIGKFPTTSGAFREVPADAPAIFVTKLGVAGTTLVYSTYLDGAGAGQAIAVDSAGEAYIAGFTYTATFSTTVGSFQRTYAGGTDAFVTKLNPSGALQVYSTFLGGSSEDQATGIKVDSTGAAFVSGFTTSSNFPVSSGAFRTTYSGATDVFVTKLSSAGATLVYSTFLGGPNADRAYGIDIDSSGAAYVAGQTFSTSFPATTGAFRTTHGGGAADAFVTKLNAAGSALTYSTFLGGSGTCTVTDPFRIYQCDGAYGISVDTAGEAYVVGLAGSGFPLAGALQSTPGGNGDAFISQLNAAGSGLVFSTFLGGASGDVALAVRTPAPSSGAVVGFTASANFPSSAGALQTSYGGGSLDGFLAHLASCSVTLGSSGSFFPATAGSYSIDVFAAASCGWSAAADVPWVTINSGSGAGNGQVGFTVASNSGGLRVGHLTVNGSTFTITQVSGQCVILGGSGSWFPQAGGAFSLPIFASCPWNGSVNVSWITFPSGSSGSGNGNLHYLMASNNTGSARFALIDVSGQTFSVSQVGSAGGITSCSFAASSSSESFGRAGGSTSILVTAPPGCEWVVANPNPWVTITSGFAGSGEGVVGISAAPNLTGQPRVALLVIAGQNMTVFQAAQ